MKAKKANLIISTVLAASLIGASTVVYHELAESKDTINELQKENMRMELEVKDTQNELDETKSKLSGAQQNIEKLQLNVTDMVEKVEVLENEKASTEAIKLKLEKQVKELKQQKK